MNEETEKKRIKCKSHTTSNWSCWGLTYSTKTVFLATVLCNLDVAPITVSCISAGDMYLVKEPKAPSELGFGV